jgi:hypothetical protein
VVVVVVCMRYKTSFGYVPWWTAGCDVMSWMGAFVGSFVRDYKVLSRMNDAGYKEIECG